ncbi:TIR domain-containing protein [Halomonas sp. M4R1S46]|uniref:TIR domain-containing protein n=1 Tax=Halomonas sp. M4R1S46 TaxID=2982692 RepID=UPI0021E3BA68|nr:TIR domain-containing protein [Halomonas sp. M4R1S46]UYG07159.1 TIR domain-containing protein [Halomonas sp. M4R1S46]
MATKQIHVFISHAWAHSGHYNTLAGWIFDIEWSSGDTDLDFKDYSVPKSDPIHNASNDKLLKEALFNQIRRSHVIAIPTGMYANYSKWIQKEIDGAREYKKPILAINPWGSQRKSSIVAEASEKSVGWNKKTVVTGLWELYNK